MTEEEQIELALKRSMMEFELMQNSFQSGDGPKDNQMACHTVTNAYNSEDIRRECSSAVAKGLFVDQEEKTSKYFKNEQGNKLKQSESESKCQGPLFKTNFSPVKHCENRTTFHELSEDNYFHSDERTRNNGSTTKEEKLKDNLNGVDGCVNDFVDSNVNDSVNSVNEIKSDDEVMIISDGSVDNESDRQMPEKSNNLASDILDAASNDVCSIKPKYSNYNAAEKPKLSTDLENIFMVDEMTADDVRPIRTVRHKIEDDSSGISEKKPDIVDLFCTEDDGNTCIYDHL